VDSTNLDENWESGDGVLSELQMRSDDPYAYRRFLSDASRIGSGRRLEMDGLARLMALTAHDQIDAQRRRRDDEFRAWHRQADALPDISPKLIQRERGPVRRLATLFGRIGAA
jgi:hypothetical protein